LALNENIAIKRGGKIFYLTYSNNVVDDDDDDTELLALGEERRNSSDREFVSTADLISYLRK